MLELNRIGEAARSAAFSLANASTAGKNRALAAIADSLVEHSPAILAANALDVEAGRQAGLSPSMVDRLSLTDARVRAMAEGVRDVMRLPDPVGRVLAGSTLDCGLQMEKIAVPLGVVGIIYEARPNVTSDAAAICLKSGNACVLRGGKEALNSNVEIARAMRAALISSGFDENCISLIEDPSREVAAAFMRLNRYVDCLIPRGGAGLIRSVIENATIPVIETGVGNCHAYVEKTADIEMAANVVFNAKLREMLGAYVTGVLADFGKDVDIVRLGLMRYSEIGYPHPSFKGRKNAYWAYDDIAQGKVEGLPAGVKPCPVPGWTPGRPSADHVDARRFAAWYVDALANFHDWQIELVARQYEGRMAMLYPSWGIREGQLESAVLNDLNGTTSAERNGEIQRAFAFKRFIEGIQNPRVMVCGTWIDSRPEWSDDDAPNPKNPCPIGHLSSLAAAHPLKLRVMGENTGGGGMAAMQLTFQRARRYGLDGVMWAFERDLHDGKPPTLEDLAPCIRAFSQRRQLP